MGLRRYTTLDARLGRPIGFRQPGTMNLVVDQAELEERRRLTDAQRALGFDVRHITGDEARDLEPWLPTSVLGGSFCQLDGAVYPFTVVKAYLRKAQEQGARLFVGTEVTGVSKDRGRVTGVQTRLGSIGASWVVNAAGAWANDVSAMVGLRTPTVPMRGQVLVTVPLPPLPRTRHIVFGVEPALRQMPTGNTLIAATIERAGYDKRVTPRAVKRFAQEIISFHPEMATTPILRGWAGLRPGSQDELPILGASRIVPGFVIASGAFRNGVLYGPAVGELIANDMLNRPQEIDLTPFRPERFETTRSLEVAFAALS
jgi:sarcosine oxidase subunit beta